MLCVLPEKFLWCVVLEWFRYELSDNWFFLEVKKKLSLRVFLILLHIDKGHINYKQLHLEYTYAYKCTLTFLLLNICSPPKVFVHLDIFILGLSKLHTQYQFQMGLWKMRIDTWAGTENYTSLCEMLIADFTGEPHWDCCLLQIVFMLLLHWGDLASFLISPLSLFWNFTTVFALFPPLSSLSASLYLFNWPTCTTIKIWPTHLLILWAHFTHVSAPWPGSNAVKAVSKALENARAKYTLPIIFAWICGLWIEFLKGKAPYCESSYKVSVRPHVSPLCRGAF